MPVKIEQYRCSKCDAVFSSEADAIKHEKTCYPPEEAEVVEYQIDATFDPSSESVCEITESTRCVEAVSRPELEGGTYYTVFGLESDDHGYPVENIVNIAATCFKVDVDYYPLTVTATCYRMADEPEPWDELKKETSDYIDKTSDELKAISAKLKEKLNAD